MFRFAVILEGIAGRVRSGNAVGDAAEAVGRMSILFAHRAGKLIESNESPKRERCYRKPI